jgi:DNA-binding NarL/FixJ family response regulator
MKLKVVAADDNSEFLRRLKSLLSAEFEVVCIAANGQVALECVERYQPEVAVLDLEMPVLNGIEVTKELRKQGSNTAVVICSVETDPETVDAAQNAGALGYVFKTRITEDLTNAVKCAAAGELFVSSRTSDSC